MTTEPRKRSVDLLLLAAMVLPTAGAWLYFVALQGSELARPAYLASKVVQFSLPVWAWAAVRRSRPRLLGSPRSALGGLASGLVLAGSLAALYAGLAGTDLAAQAALRIRSTLQEFGVASPGAYLALAAGLSLGHSLLEEVYWRGFVFRGLEARLRPAPAVVLASLAFASHHLIVVARYAPLGSFWLLAVPATAAVAVGGAHWCGLFRRSGSLLAPWISHLLVDAALMGIGWHLVACR